MHNIRSYCAVRGCQCDNMTGWTNRYVRVLFVKNQWWQYFQPQRHVTSLFLSTLATVIRTRSRLKHKAVSGMAWRYLTATDRLETSVSMVFERRCRTDIMLRRWPITLPVTDCSAPSPRFSVVVSCCKIKTATGWTDWTPSDNNYQPMPVHTQAKLWRHSCRIRYIYYTCF